MLDLSIENHAPDCLKRKLKNVCRTRWVEQIAGLDDFEDLYISIACCLESMSVIEGKVCNSETPTKASSLYKLIASFYFQCLTLQFFGGASFSTSIARRKTIVQLGSLRQRCKPSPLGSRGETLEIFGYFVF